MTIFLGKSALYRSCPIGLDRYDKGDFCPVMSHRSLGAAMTHREPSGGLRNLHEVSSDEYETS
jgi:hypothetical protein